MGVIPGLSYQRQLFGAAGGKYPRMIERCQSTIIGGGSSGNDAIGPRVRSIWTSTNMDWEVSPQLPGHGAAISAADGSAGPPVMANPSRATPELPPANVKRWTIRRKAAVVSAIAHGVLTREEACQRYQISEEELASWQHAYEAHGLQGLRSTRLQQYRARPPREQ
ncbi:MAG TPA: DUF1153 domain-containing protein [Stellaceae bacterium]|nr:DUF1153 domain-containing protein [Stellaceae bacterium]